MKVIDSEQILYVDVDDTLLMWNVPFNHLTSVKFFNPYTKHTVSVTTNRANIQVLKGRLARGATVIVHSASGYQWAEQAIIALGLEKEENIYVASKPLGYIDDKKCEHWMGDHIYLDVDNRYGRD